MKVFQVRQDRTGAILWTGLAAGEIQALDAMAHEAGYYDHSDIPDAVRRGGLSVEALKFEPTRAVVSQRMTQGGRTGQTAAHGGSSARRSDLGKVRNG